MKEMVLTFSAFRKVFKSLKFVIVWWLERASFPYIFVLFALLRDAQVWSPLHEPQETVGPY